MPRPNNMSEKAWLLLKRSMPGVVAQGSGGGTILAALKVDRGWMLFDARSMPLGKYSWVVEDGAGNIVSDGVLSVRR